MKEVIKWRLRWTNMLLIRSGDEIERKNLLIENENLIVVCLTKDVVYTSIDYVLTISRFSDMHEAYTVAQERIAKLKVEDSNLTQKVQNDDHDEMLKHFFKFEVEHLNLQLKYQHLEKRFGNKKSVTSSDAHVFESVFEIGNLKEQLQGRDNTIRELKAKFSCLQKKHSEADPILDFKVLDSQNKDLNAKVNVLQDLNEHFRVENKKVKQHNKELKTKCVPMLDPVKPKGLALSMNAVDVEPIPLYNRNNREVHLEYLKHLKESVGTLCEIVEEVRVEKPLDCSLACACLYTKHSLELLEYIIGTCPKYFNKRDRNNAIVPLIRKKQVTFIEACETSTYNIQTYVEQQKMKNTNELEIPSIGVKGAIAASGSKPRINIKKDRTLSAKSDPKTVENHPRNNKSSVIRKNRVDSSISSKRTKVLNLLKKVLLIREEAVEASKRRRSLLDHKIQQLSKGSSEGFEVADKQAGNVQTSLTLSFAKLEIQSMVDVPIHQEDPAVQRTPLIDTVISMVTDKTSSTPTPPTTQAQV
nr:hypothetical protein [Tanacetum cinerariifolium]